MTSLPPVGSIGLVRVNGIVGLLIRLGQWLNGDGGRNYEHAFVLVASGRDLPDAWIVEAEPGGCRETVLSKYRGRRVLWLDCPPEHSESVAAAARSYIGLPYSVEDYFAIAAQRLGLPGAGELREAVTKSRHVICSQMADAAAHQGGWDLFPLDRWDGYVTPAVLARCALALGYRRQTIE